MIDFNQWGAEPKKEIDFATIKAIALQNIETVLHRWQPGGKIIKNEYQCGTVTGGKGESCSTNINTGVGSDFASGEKWGDLIDLVAQAEKVQMGEAANILADFLHITDNTPPPPPVHTFSESEKREQAIKASISLWVEGESCPPNHPYLVKKQVNADNGIKYHPATGCLLIPLRDGVDLLGVQRIDANGDKKVNHGGRLSGCYHVIQGEHDAVYICEGYATAMTVAMATGKTAVMAVSAGNLYEVGKKISEAYPSAHLIFAADNDQGGEKNPGIEAANKAAKKIGRGTVIYPPFPEGQKGDWNDYALTNGGKLARELLLRPVLKKRMFIDAKTMTLKEPAFLVDDVIESPCTGMIFGPSGSGKSFFVFDIALCCATGKPWNGKTVKSGPVIYICGEGRHAIPRRIKAWEMHHGVSVPYNRLMVSVISIDFEPESIASMVAEINEMVEHAGQTPVMIIIDTMARALPGNSDENSTKDTGLFIKECDALQTLYDCSVMIVHHTGHSESKRARGSSALKGAMDVEIMVTSDGTIEWTKTKDIETPSELGFEIKQIVYGQGKHDNSCVLEYTKKDEQKGPKLTANMKAAIKSLQEAVEAEGNTGSCHVGTWRDKYKHYVDGVSDRARQKSFKEQMKIMEENEEIEVKGTLVTALQLRDEMITNAVFQRVMK